MNIHEIIIIGAGPAGISASIQLKRYGFSVPVIEKNEIGGLILNANLIENYPGFPNGISGIKFVSLLKKQIKLFELKIHKEDVKLVDFTDDTFIITTNKKSWKCHKLIIATGTVPLIPGIPEITPAINDKVFFEVFPLINQTKKNIAIVGGGDAAFDYALNLSRNNNVTILNRTSKISCLPVLNERCLNNNKIKYLDNISVANITPSEKGLNLECNNSGKKETMQFDIAVFAIGRKPNNDFFTITLNDNIKELISAKRLFLIGDIQNGYCRQLAVSAGDGIKAAMELINHHNFDNY